MGSCRWLSRLPIAIALLLVLATTPLRAQSENRQCSCFPRVYEITLDFSRTCNDNSGYGTGVQETRCNIVPFNDPSDTDLVPELVTLIDVSELGQNLQSIVGSQRLTGRYENGATIAISSVSDNKDDLDFDNMPKAFQMSMIGVNANGGTLVFSALIVYTGSCQDYPVLLFGTSNGWALLTEQVGPHADLCPAAGSLSTSSPAPSIALTLPPISETTSIPSIAPIVAETAVPDSPTPMPMVSPRTPVPTTTTGTLAPTKLSQTNRPTTHSTRTPLPTMTPIKEQTTAPGNKKMVCTHIKESDSKKRSNKMSKSGKGGKSEKIVKSSKSGKRSSSKSGKKKKKKRNKRKKRDINKSSHTVWTNKGKRRILNEMEKRNVYFQVHGDVFRDRNADVPMNNATTPDEAVYVAIYKEVFPDVECYEIDVEPTSSPPTSAEEPSSLSDPSVSLSPMISQSPFSVSPTVTMTAPSMNPTTNTTFDDLVLDRANMTGPLEDRSNPINSTWTEANTAYGNRRSTTLIHTWVVVATFLGGTVWMSIFLIRWYGPQKPMRHIRIPSHRHRSSSDGSRRSDEERSVESRLTDDKRMGV